MDNRVSIQKLNEMRGTSGEFSVVQFFEDGSHEYVREFVSDEEAALAAHFYTNNVAAKMGLVKRVIITDGGDCCCFEWKHGEGIVFGLSGQS